MDRGRRARVAALLCLVVAALATVLGAGTASAHAVLERTSPSADAVVPDTPARVTLTFGESVTLVPSAVRVYDAQLQRADAGPADHVDGDPATAGVALRPDLAPGTYAVTWRVVSADSHPIEGGFRFSVGHPGAAAVVPDATNGPGAVGVLLGLARFVEYAGLAGVGGLLVFGWLTRAGASAGVRRRAWRPVVVGWWLLAVGTLAALLLQGPDAQGLPVTAVADPSVLLGTLGGPTGVLELVRLGLVLLLGVALRPAQAGGPLVPAGVAATGAAVTFSLGGHAGVGSWYVLGVLLDAAHLVAMAPWVGGVAVLVAALWARTPEPDAGGSAAAVLPRFSRLAQVAVLVVVVTGTVQSVRNVGEIGALVGTTYGWLLLAKIVVVVPLLLLGNRARTAVARWSAPAVGAPPRPRAFALSLSPAPRPVTTEPRPVMPDTDPATSVHGLRRGLLAEVGVTVVVLAVTAALVATPQAAESYAPSFRDTQSADGMVLDARVDAAHTGATTLHLTGRDRSGAPLPLTLVTGSLSLPSQQIGPLPLSGTGAVDPSVPVTFPVPGTWAADVTVTAAGRTPVVFRIEIPVR